MVTKINDTQKQNLLNNRYIIEEKIGTSKKISSTTKDMNNTIRRVGGVESLYSQVL